MDAAAAGDTVLVTNGLYATGGRLVSAAGDTTNRVAVEKPIRVQSVNGPGVTVIEGARGVNSTFFGLGDEAIRCAYLGEGGLLSGFTLTNGYTKLYRNGGGAWCTPSA